MRKFARNLVYRPDGSPINPLAHLFFYITFVFGAAYVFFGDTAPVQASILFIESKSQFNSSVLSIWGVAAIITTMLNTWLIGSENTKNSHWGAMLGFLLWMYAFLVYALGGFWFQLLATAIPNLAFWAWYYFAIIRYRSYIRQSS
jgi:hypothetical protein